MTKILGISGSLRRASSNTGLLRALQSMAPGHVTVEIATLHGIPLFNEDDEAASGRPEAVEALQERIRAADGVVIACPEYNFSFTGVLKNANDWLSRGGSPFRWKRVGIIGAGGGQFVGTARAQYHLRQNLQALQAITMPRPEVFVNHNEEKFDADGNLTDAETQRYLAKWLEAFLEWVEKKP
ncbi:MAG: NAD(P)H-dependent oxidoreductase [Aestuariivirga sp.]|nr:NAD(P)H-dependent oxidoreductase [Aestuariivirga sp.]